ncbi:HNH endonuclease [Streptomyces umbrinus]|uniref:HNH endonuclease n=1 Tax=Streptomyces umbrinus TaxID=67370 RepID=UPI0034319689
MVRGAPQRGACRGGASKVRPARLPCPTASCATTVGRAVAGSRLSAARSVPRPMRITPLSRPLAPPVGPSRRDVLRRWEELEWWSCAYCDEPFGQKVVAEIDHVRPLARGGLHEWSNLAPSCAGCNRDKADRDVTEWLSNRPGQSFTEGRKPVT